MRSPDAISEGKGAEEVYLGYKELNERDYEECHFVLEALLWVECCELKVRLRAV